MLLAAKRQLQHMPKISIPPHMEILFLLFVLLMSGRMEIIMKKAVLTFICSLILMGGFGAAALPEKAEPAFEQSSYSTLSNYDPGSMPKIIYVV